MLPSSITELSRVREGEREIIVFFLVRLSCMSVIWF